LTIERASRLAALSRMNPERLTSVAAWDISVFSLRRWVGAAA